MFLGLDIGLPHVVCMYPLYGYHVHNSVFGRECYMIRSSDINCGGILICPNKWYQSFECCNMCVFFGRKCCVTESFNTNCWGIQMLPNKWYQTFDYRNMPTFGMKCYVSGSFGPNCWRNSDAPQQVVSEL